METVKQWCAAPRGGNIWLHGLDVLGHILRGDHEAASLPRINNAEIKADDRNHLHGLRQAIEQYQRDTHLDELCEEVFSKPRRRTRHQFGQDGDDLHVDGYIEGNTKQFFTSAVREERRHKPALSICFDFSVSWGERNGQEMRLRQLDAYDLVVQAEREGRPCRVVAVSENTYSDRPELGLTRWHVVVKDWNEPIFPALWGVFQSSKTTNSFANLISAFIVGGHPYGNGAPVCFTFDSLPEGEDVVLVGQQASRRLGPLGNHIIYKRPARAA